MTQGSHLISQTTKKPLGSLFSPDALPKIKWKKRFFDILFSTSILIVFLPVYLLIALWIKATSKGPIFYHHERVTMGGKSFFLVKFRTMYQDADARLTHILQKNPQAKQEWEAFRKIKNDPRITPVGKFLRRTSLDELPQFWNVIKGDISVVGPRPVKEDEIRMYYKEKAVDILSVLPGITGLWQVSGRNQLSMDQRVALELKYVKKQSFFFDLYLILRTIPAIFFSKGAY
jgi:exopolysaccharide production protein ExoY